jgi:hypothetical protein
VLPAVRDRQALVSTLRSLLGDLGLKRRAKAMASLAEYLATRGDNGTGDAQNRPQSDALAAGQATTSTDAESSQGGAAGAHREARAAHAS